MKKTAKLAKERLVRILHNDRMVTGRGRLVPIPGGGSLEFVIQKVRR